MITFAFDFSNIGTILLFAIILCFLIAWHELGHLLVAKKCNVYCYEYAIGFGPILYKNTAKLECENILIIYNLDLMTYYSTSKMGCQC